MAPKCESLPRDAYRSDFNQSRLNTLRGPGPAGLTGPPLETPKASNGRRMGRGPLPQPIRESEGAS